MYENSKVETQVAVNPTNPGNVIGVYQQDRWYREGARGLMAAHSSDGGVTWGLSVLPFGACAGGLPFDRVSDPWVSIGAGVRNGPPSHEAQGAGPAPPAHGAPPDRVRDSDVGELPLVAELVERGPPRLPPDPQEHLRSAIWRCPAQVTSQARG